MHRLLALLAAAPVAASLLAGCDSGGATASDPPLRHQPSPSSAPRSLEDLPVGRPSGVPWWHADALHVGGRSVSTPYRQLVAATGTVAVGASSVRRGARWFVLDGERLVPLVSSVRPLVPVVAADGRTLAWSEATGATTRRLVAYDVASHTVRGVEQLTVHPVCCDAGGEVQVLGVDSDGRVVYTVLGEGTRLWTPGGPDVSLRGAHGGQVVDPWPGGVTWQARATDPFAGSPGVVATVDASGLAHRVGTVPTDQLGSWNADGSAYDYPGQADGGAMPKAPMPRWWIAHLDGSRTALRLPTGPDLEVVGWESPASVVLQVRNPYAEPLPADEHPGLVALVRCDAATGACERTGDDVSPRAVLPGS